MGTLEITSKNMQLKKPEKEVWGAESKPSINLSIYGKARRTWSGVSCNKGIRGCNCDLLKDVAERREH